MPRRICQVGHAGEPRPEPVVQNAAQPAPLVLEDCHRLAAKLLEIVGQSLRTQDLRDQRDDHAERVPIPGVEPQAPAAHADDQHRVASDRQGSSVVRGRPALSQELVAVEQAHIRRAIDSRIASTTARGPSSGRPAT